MGFDLHIIDQSKWQVWNTVIRAALDEFNGLKLKLGDYGPFCNKVTQKKLLVIGINPDCAAMNKTAGQAAWDKLMGKPDDINSLMLEEIIFQLEKVIFGTTWSDTMRTIYLDA